MTPASQGPCRTADMPEVDVMRAAQSFMLVEVYGDSTMSTLSVRQRGHRDADDA